MRRPTAAGGLPRIAVAALLAAACSDAVSPDRRSPGAPAFSHTPASGAIALDQNNGSLNQNGTCSGAPGPCLIKGFDPVSPHRGSTVIATFYWLGSTNIINSVTDHLNDATFTPVGNTYRLVEYVTAGGISMATYVATNVQGFPDPTRVGTDPVLAVRANLSTSVVDGGIKISAFTGVEPDFTLALGAHRSASGSGSTLTTAAPGPIAVGAGALAYAVTMSNGLYGVTPPSGFTAIGGTASDAFIVEDGRFRVPTSAETTDPRWTWHFESPSTWLATVLTLNPGDPPPSGSLTVTTSTTGTNPDPDGYTVTVSGTSRSVPPNGNVTLTVPAGDQQVTLLGVAGNCTVSGANPRTVTVPDGGTTSTTFDVSCSTGGSGARIAGVGTTGSGTASPNSNRQEFDFDVAVDLTGRLFYRDWSTVRAEGTPVTITVSATDASTRITAFREGSTVCADPTRGTEFDGTGRLDNGALTGFTVRACDDGPAGSGADFFEMSAPGYLKGGLLSSGDIVKSTAANQAPTANFTFSCSGLTCSFTSTSSDPDGTIASYSWTFGDGTSSTAQNPSKTYAAGGSYTVTLRVTDNQGALSAPTSKTVTVTASNQAPTANFTFSCSGLTCSFTSTSSDPDGTIASYNWTFGDGTSSTVQNPSKTYAAGGSYTVTLRVTDNQGAVSAPTSKTVTVTAPNQTPTANFTFSCSGLTCSFTSTSSDPDGTIASYNWTFGDGTSSTAQNPSKTYAAGGSYTVTLRVTDNQGAVSAPTSKTVTVTAPNSAPVVDAGPDETALTGLLYTFSWSFTDANGNGPWSYTIDWGDGSTSTGSVSSQGTFSAGHTYVVLLPRDFTIRVTVRDAAGASGSDTKVVTVLLL